MCVEVLIAQSKRYLVCNNKKDDKMYEDNLGHKEIAKLLAEVCKYINSLSTCECKIRHPEYLQWIREEARKQGINTDNNPNSVCDFPGCQNKCPCYSQRG